MTDHPELKRLISSLPDFAETMRQAYSLGEQHGREAAEERGAARERERIAQALASAGIVLPRSTPTVANLPPAAASAPQAAPEATEKPARQTTEYGVITKTVKSALDALQSVKEGVGPLEIVEYCKQQGMDLDPGQARTALKVLARQRQAVRVQRGKYKRGPTMPSWLETQPIQIQ